MAKPQQVKKKPSGAKTGLKTLKKPAAAKQATPDIIIPTTPLPTEQPSVGLRERRRRCKKVPGGLVFTEQAFFALASLGHLLRGASLFPRLDCKVL